MAAPTIKEKGYTVKQSSETATVRSSDGTTLAYDRVGTGPAVVLVGGGPTDRKANAPVADLLAESFTVYNYDRRGRGASSDTEPYAVDRECEDLAAVIDAAGGRAGVYGTSSGAILTMEAATRGVPAASLALWEPGYVVDDSRTPPPADLAPRFADLVAAGRNGDALELFFTSGADMPAKVVESMRSAPFWAEMEPLARPLIHDLTMVGDFSLPAERLKSISVPTLVIDGATTPWLTSSAEAVAAAVPGAVRRTIAEQPHNVDAAAIAPVLVDWFSNAGA
jgi:pimeloyl-ACP methyl ester carboxylesterase